MKKFFVILGAALALCLALAGCDDSGGSGGSDGPKSIIVTGIDTQYNGKIAMIMVIAMTGGGGMPAAQGMGTVSGNKVTFALTAVENDGTPTAEEWTGSGGHMLQLAFVTGSGDGEQDKYIYTNGGAFPSNPLDLPKYDIAEEVSTIAFSKFKAIPDDDD